MMTGLFRGRGGWVTVSAPSNKGFRFSAEIIPEQGPPEARLNLDLIVKTPRAAATDARQFNYATLADSTASLIDYLSSWQDHQEAC
jgi:hypothetical protein